MTKLVTFQDAKGTRLGAVLDDGRVLDVAAAGGPADMLSLIEGGAAALSSVKAKAANPPSGAVLAAGSVKLLAPIPRPRRNVFCVGRVANPVKGIPIDPGIVPLVQHAERGDIRQGRFCDERIVCFVLNRKGEGAGLERVFHPLLMGSFTC